MVQKGSPTKGDIENKHMLTDVVAVRQAADTSLLKGIFVYQDGANGAKVVPVDDSVEARRARFIENDSNNKAITGIQEGLVGDKEVETYKEGAIVIAQCDGPIQVGDYVRTSTVNAGDVETLPTPATPGGATPTDQNLNDIQTWIKMRLAVYLGHAGESSSIGNDLTDAVDRDLVRLQLL